MHGRDAGAQRRMTRAGAENFTVERGLATISAERAREHVHEGGFARAVLADQRVNLAWARLEVDAVERERAAEAFSDGGGA